ncbi:MAG: alanine racemase [Acidobacteriota bacterium]
MRPAWVDVDLDALTANLATMRRAVGPAKILAVVKADAYGHGSAPVGLALEQAGVDWLGVALVEEGAWLRRAGVMAPVLVLGTVQPQQLPLFRRYDLMPTVSSLDQLQLWADYARDLAYAQPLHLKIDTGMTRLGLALDETARGLSLLREHPHLELAGLLSHLADADLLESSHNAEQTQRFDEVLALLTPAERERIDLHLANSAGSLHHEETRHTLVRLGLALYGLDPAGNTFGLRPVMSVRARIVHLREVPEGTPLGYGGRRITSCRSRIAVVPIGYADGYSWRLSNKAEVLVGGARLPVAGAVSMDMTLVDVTGTGAALGDEVVLMGEQGKESIGAAELALIAGTIPYELLCLLGLRLVRRYWQAGSVVDVRSRFFGVSL